VDVFSKTRPSAPRGGNSRKASFVDRRFSLFLGIIPISCWLVSSLGVALHFFFFKCRYISVRFRSNSPGLAQRRRPREKSARCVIAAIAIALKIRGESRGGRMPQLRNVAVFAGARKSRRHVASRRIHRYRKPRDLNMIFLAIKQKHRIYRISGELVAAVTARR